MGEPDKDGGLRAQSERARADFQTAADDVLALLEQAREHAGLLAAHEGEPAPLRRAEDGRA
ncbi:hypothetical protein [Segniliparus rugosus]|uniref:Uncharacterized protein n=1 Tax=Segniliparus rugosus (strain ATCC BAA-974 / DSM 45345 / CCUG 50838 / CIP 108380 / JCM 13579 / CDC 945) TaxID=679197 RepID=E5XQH1_SEGRC|nr:hypothetical protein [Segniliparus rugosus]EFV13412.1 hypothetical protein HMPREF9336_01743 [Segniliparus rugosus ATCC BAA-974]